MDEEADVNTGLMTKEEQIIEKEDNQEKNSPLQRTINSHND